MTKAKHTAKDINTELLEALEHLILSTGVYHRDGNVGFSVEQARAVIAKVKGA